MTSLLFTRNEKPTLGVELELQLVDAETLELRSAISDVLDRVPKALETRIKPEFMQSYLEINTEICETVADVETDLLRKLQVIHQIAAELNLRLFWSATHPFSHWADQKITANARYYGLVELLQDTARRLVTFGLHVHVGVDTGDKAIMVCDRILRHLPTLLALSVNSPFWNGRMTGLKSQRSKVMENLPTADLPPLMRNWSEYTWLVKHLQSTGFIHTIREIWWDVRPHHNFGTVEVRICDMPGTLQDVLGLTALIQCLVEYLSDEIDAGAYQHDCHPSMVRQNKWRACRYGMSANLVNPYTQQVLPATDVVKQLVDHLMTTAERLGCADYLEEVRRIVPGATGADRQLALYEETGDLREVVRRLTDETAATISAATALAQH